MKKRAKKKRKKVKKSKKKSKKVSLKKKKLIHSKEKIKDNNLIKIKCRSYSSLYFYYANKTKQLMSSLNKE